jgi:hypothetical protein
MNQLLRDLFREATNYDLHGGMTWYKDAHFRTKRLATALKIPHYKVIGVLSALSPRNKWDRNMVDTVNVLRKGKKAKVATFSANKEKALRIIKAQSPNEVEQILNGRKTQSFYRNILMPTLPTTVTIDLWAYRSLGLEQVNKNYSKAENAYKEVAKEIGILPHQLQAIIWSKVRGSYV